MYGLGGELLQVLCKAWASDAECGEGFRCTAWEASFAGTVQGLGV